ncbi:MAG: PilZ domain-containing protein [Planctomycetes bacterium]|nr:PilZ domain-containing protein [Planctomycetota bacterium]
MGSDKRTYPRVGVNVSIDRPGNALNISESGICILADDPLPIDYEVKLNLSLPGIENEAPGNLHIEGVIVWIKFLEELEKFEIGIKFSKMEGGSRAQVKAFIEKHSQNNSQSGQDL